MATKKPMVNIPNYKILIVGDEQVGKSSLIDLYVNNQVKPKYQPTIEEHHRITVTIDTDNYLLDIYDVDTQLLNLDQDCEPEPHPFGRPKLSKAYSDTTLILPSKLPKADIHKYVNMCDGFIILYSIIDRSSYAAVDHYIEKISKIKKNASTICLVGTKLDLLPLRQVSKREGLQKAMTHKIQFYETSIITKKNVDFVFEKLVKTIAKLKHPRKLTNKSKSFSSLLSNPHFSQAHPSLRPRNPSLPQVNENLDGLPEVTFIDTFYLHPSSTCRTTTSSTTSTNYNTNATNTTNATNSTSRYNSNRVETRQRSYSCSQF